MRNFFLGDNGIKMMIDTQIIPNMYLFKINNKNARKSCEICSKLTIKTPERRP